MNLASAVSLLILLCLSVCAQEGTKAQSGLDTTEPFWKSPVMVGESVLFVKRGGQVSGKLLFPPTKIIEVKSSSGKLAYLEGKDYKLRPGTNEIIIPSGSAIPVTPAKTLTPPLGSQPFDLKRRDKKGDILFGEKDEYANMQVVFTYEHEPGSWGPAPPVYARQDIPKVLQKLEAGEPVSIVFFGDSITEGGNASKFINVPPFLPAYPERVIHNLEHAYKSKITYKNYSVGGMTAEWGLKNVDKVAAEKADLVVLGWGMNDSSGKTPRPIKDFVRDLGGQMDIINKKNANTEFIVVASMLPNEDCYWTNPGVLLDYRDTIRKLSGGGVAVADLTSVWEELLKTKSYLDMTGNGVNHPNDWGHRLYADVVSALLIKQ